MALETRSERGGLERLRSGLDASIAAIGLLTVLPVASKSDLPERVLGQAVRYFPIVGLLIGTIVAAFDFALGRVLPSSVVSALDLLVLAVLTGGLHLDALMDTCDGLFAPRQPAERLAIMRDSRVGSFGVVGGVLVLLAQYACLSELDGTARMIGLILMGVLGRWSMVIAITGFRSARPDGLGATFKRATGPIDALIATAIAAVVAGGLFGPAGLGLGGVVGAGTLGVAAFAEKRLNGLTGDVYGAINEVAVTITLLGLTAMPATIWRFGM